MYLSVYVTVCVSLFVWFCMCTMYTYMILHIYIYLHMQMCLHWITLHVSRQTYNIYIKVSMNMSDIALCCSLEMTHPVGSLWQVACADVLILNKVDLVSEAPSTVSEGFLKCGYLKIIHFIRISHYKPSILGYPHLWKPPNVMCSEWKVVQTIASDRADASSGYPQRHQPDCEVPELCQLTQPDSAWLLFPIPCEKAPWKPFCWSATASVQQVSIFVPRCVVRCWGPWETSLGWRPLIKIVWLLVGLDVCVLSGIPLVSDKPAQGLAASVLSLPAFEAQKKGQRSTEFGDFDDFALQNVSRWNV